MSVQRLGFLGMSTVGKTHWAIRLAREAGYQHFDCDGILNERLRAELGLSSAEMEAVGRWMGFPYEPGYAEREALYLARERAVLEEGLAQATQATASDQPIVIDMGGSAIYAGGQFFEQLRRSLTLVYLTVAPAVHEEMLREYTAQPRPLVWNGQFRQEAGESHKAALARCYLELLTAREALYATYSDMTLDYTLHRNPALPVADFLSALKRG